MVFFADSMGVTRVPRESLADGRDATRYFPSGRRLRALASGRRGTCVKVVPWMIGYQYHLKILLELGLACCKEVVAK
jgi:hypothetical protein